MFSKMKKVIISTLIGALGLGISGLLFATLQTMEEENIWLWILGWVVIGIISMAVLGFSLGGTKKLSNSAMWGAAAGVASGFLTGNPDYELWLKMAIIGLLFGAAMGMVCGSFNPESKKKENKKADERAIRCDECGAKVAKDDKYCHECGTEFE
jgi:ribose/xylose/arabinose/galactoside ABC-type transport system permease subunit